MNLLIIFIVLSFLNVILSTIRNRIMVFGGKWANIMSNTLYFMFYTVMLIYTVSDFPLIYKVAVTGLSNFIGSYIVITTESALKKDKLWKIEFTAKSEFFDGIKESLKFNNIPNNFIDIGKYTIFNCYCATQAESAMVKAIMAKYGCKYFVSEGKVL